MRIVRAQQTAIPFIKAYGKNLDNRHERTRRKNRRAEKRVWVVKGGKSSTLDKSKEKVRGNEEQSRWMGDGRSVWEVMAAPKYCRAKPRKKEYWVNKKWVGWTDGMG